MKNLQTTLASVILATLLGSSIAQAQDDPAVFDFRGCMQSIPTSNGQPFKMVGFLTNNGVIPTPIPFTWTGQEHTIVIEATFDHQVSITQYFTNATVKIYTDVGPATPGDYANQATFSDFDLVLSGVINNFQRLDFPGSQSSYAGGVDWTGGSRLGELGVNTTGYGIGGTGNTSSGDIPSGYADCWNGKIDQPVVAVEENTWGGVKELYNN
jgi:hypothetical protein